MLRLPSMSLNICFFCLLCTLMFILPSMFFNLFLLPSTHMLLLSSTSPSLCCWLPLPVSSVRSSRSQPSQATQRQCLSCCIILPLPTMNIFRKADSQAFSFSYSSSSSSSCSSLSVSFASLILLQVILIFSFLFFILLPSLFSLPHLLLSLPHSSSPASRPLLSSPPPPPAHWALLRAPPSTSSPA